MKNREQIPTEFTQHCHLARNQNGIPIRICRLYRDEGLPTIVKIQVSKEASRKTTGRWPSKQTGWAKLDGKCWRNTSRRLKIDHLLTKTWGRQEIVILVQDRIITLSIACRCTCRQIITRNVDLQVSRRSYDAVIWVTEVVSLVWRRVKILLKKSNEEVLIIPRKYSKASVDRVLEDSLANCSNLSMPGGSHSNNHRGTLPLLKWLINHNPLPK